MLISPLRVAGFANAINLSYGQEPGVLADKLAYSPASLKRVIPLHAGIHVATNPGVASDRRCFMDTGLRRYDSEVTLDSGLCAGD